MCGFLQETFPNTPVWAHTPDFVTMAPFYRIILKLTYTIHWTVHPSKVGTVSHLPLYTGLSKMNMLDIQCLTEEQGAKVHVLQSSQPPFRYRIL